MGPTFSKRPCKLSGSANGRTEMHGEDSVAAVDISISAFMLNADELNKLTVDEHFDRRVIDTPKGSKGAKESGLRRFKPLQLRDKYVNCNVALSLGLAKDALELEQCRIAKITLEPTTGGLTEMTMQVQCTPDEKQIARIFAFLNKDIDARVKLGKPEETTKPQPELALEVESRAPIDDLFKPPVGGTAPKRTRSRKPKVPGGDLAEAAAAEPSATVQ